MSLTQRISPWVYTFPAEIMVCDPHGIILEMNETAIQFYQAEGGAAMVGRNVFDHHEEPVRSQVRSMIQTQRKVMYTTEKGGEKRLVVIAPWYQDGEYTGFALMTLELPEKMPNIVKD